MSLSDVIIEIKKIIGKEQMLSIEIFSGGEIAINIYEKPISISITKDKNECFIETEIMSMDFLTYQYMKEITDILKLINDNIIIFKRLWG